MAPSTAFRPIARIQPAAQAQELPVLRLTLQGPEGEIQRMTLLSTIGHDSVAAQAHWLVPHIHALAAQAAMRVIEIQQLSHMHVEMRRHSEFTPL